jgi:hypothetical protein
MSESACINNIRTPTDEDRILTPQELIFAALSVLGRLEQRAEATLDELEVKVSFGRSSERTMVNYLNGGE